MTHEDRERIAADTHDKWCTRLLDAGISSRISPLGDNEELLAPWSRLSDQAKKYNTEGLDETLQAIEAAGYVIVPRASLLRAKNALHDMEDEK